MLIEDKHTSPVTTLIAFRSRRDPNRILKCANFIGMLTKTTLIGFFFLFTSQTFRAVEAFYFDRILTFHYVTINVKKIMVKCQEGRKIVLGNCQMCFADVFVENVSELICKCGFDFDIEYQCKIDLN